MLRRARWLLLLAILLLIGFTAFTFLSTRQALKQARPKASAPLPPNTSATARQWEYDIKEGDRRKVAIKAANFRQVKEPSTFLLEGLEMRIYPLDGSKFHHLVKSPSATFDIKEGILFSEGDVDITLRVPEPGEPAGRSMNIKSSGAVFDSKTNRIDTEKHAVFTFDQGDGESDGATYDSASQELVLRKNAVINWKGNRPGVLPLRIETDTLIYKERASEIFLLPRARLLRSTLTLDTAEAVVKLQDGLITAVEARNAHGIDKLEKRQIDFASQQIYVYFTPDSAIRQIQGRPNASAPEGPTQSRMVSASATAWTTITSDQVDLDFTTNQGESLLHRVFANGKTRVESRAVAKPGAPGSPSRVLTSEIVEMFMRPGGEQIDNVKTHTPGQIEFLPVKPGDKRRRVNAERMDFLYAEGNMLKDFRAVNEVVTRTETVTVDPATKKPATTVATTKSANMQAAFDPKTGVMSRLEQWDNFEYQEEKKRAKSDRAILDNDRQLITLRANARAWDDSGSTTADEIVLDQNTGDSVAMGRVASTRLPAAKRPAGPAAAPAVGPASLMDAGEPLQARAERMAVTEKNQKIRYEGNALLWQGPSRLQAETVLIDQAANTLVADGKVVSIVPDRRGAAPRAGAKTPARSVSSVVTADHLDYSEAASLAHYTGNARLERPGLEVTSREMRAFLRQEPASDGSKETKLDKLFADGDVKIVERSPNRSRTGNSEHAEYYLDEERIVLTGGNPVITDSQRGLSRGRLITWFARQDRLIVDNTGGGPSVTRIDKKK